MLNGDGISSIIKSRESAEQRGSSHLYPVQHRLRRAAKLASLPFHLLLPLRQAAVYTVDINKISKIRLRRKQHALLESSSREKRALTNSHGQPPTDALSLRPLPTEADACPPMLLRFERRLFQQQLCRSHSRRKACNSEELSKPQRRKLARFSFGFT